MLSTAHFNVLTHLQGELVARQVRRLFYRDFVGVQHDEPPPRCRLPAVVKRARQRCRSSCGGGTLSARAAGAAAAAAATAGVTADAAQRCNLPPFLRFLEPFNQARPVEVVQLVVADLIYHILIEKQGAADM